ncbi:choloylglycine hydrolase [Planktothricoides sp. SR001]|uniref:linear amide C-N hydrolase n=1 Tax=Planktothricoides sp. SR001 TaxID=1705388 RepID=UPI0006C05297|nr:linear amide C-N hydrolase [Planktothricoides sp. SR001]KOR36858.1 choloylglycine hydrolase [Planktothricoides sp. SR001]
MCTRILWTGKDKSGKFHSICGRNMDWGIDMGEKLWVFPAGLKRKSDVKGKPVEWVSKYGSIATIVYDQATSDGMNEKGLGVHANWLAKSFYGERDESKPGLDCNRALQYFLDNFATVKEVVEYFKNNQDMQLVETKITKGKFEVPIECHLAIEDAQGESLIVEYLNKNDDDDTKPRVLEVKIYYSGDLPELYLKYCNNLDIPSEKKEEYKANYLKAYNVLTNNPTFKKQLENLKNYKYFISDDHLNLPGDTDASSRFVRGAYYLINLPEPTNQREAIAQVLSVMRSTAQPFRKPKPDSNALYASSTRWRTVAACTEKLYMYESSVNPTLIWLDANKLDFKEGSGVRVFDLTKHETVIGEVSEKLTPAEDLFGKNLSE